MSFARRQLFKHKHLPGGAGGGPYVSPYLLEILSTRSGAPAWTSATGTLTANTGQVVSCSRASSAYCLGDDGLLHLLGANTVRVEPSGLLVEGASTNYLFKSDLQSLGTGGDGALGPFGGSAPTITLNSTDVTDPEGQQKAAKFAFAARGSPTDTGWVYALTSGGNGCASTYIRTAPGAGTQTVYFHRTTAAGAVNGSISFSIGETWTRLAWTAAGYWVIGFGNDSGDSFPTGAVTYYIWRPQYEPTLPFATSPITTTALAAATRSGDYVTVTNPLASLSQPVPAWTASCRAIENPGYTWAPDGDSAIIVFLAMGPNGGANAFRLLKNGATSTPGTEYNDGASGQRTLSLPSALASTVAVMSGRNALGTLTGTPGGGTISGTGTGIVDLSAATTLSIGKPQGFPDTFGIRSGWMTDIVLDNK